jgi:hypothetical protein
MNLEQERQCGKNEKLKMSFDLYLPTATFRKASPGLPNYRITVVGYLLTKVNFLLCLGI